jgi:hypothetical protein
VFSLGLKLPEACFKNIFSSTMAGQGIKFVSNQACALGARLRQIALAQAKPCQNPIPA